MFVGDSIFSLFQHESILVDSLPQKRETASQTEFLGFEGIPLEQTWKAENWVFCLLFLSFFLFCFCAWLNRGGASDKANSILNLKEHYMGFFSQKFFSSPFVLLLSLLFSCCLIALCAYVVVIESKEALELLVYFKFFLLTVAFLLFKLFFTVLLSYVFFYNASCIFLLRYVCGFFLFLGCTFFFLLVIVFYGPFLPLFYLKIAVFSLCCLAVSITLVKLVQIFFVKKTDVFYILLYLCTLEILPVLLLFYLYKLIV